MASVKPFAFVLMPFSRSFGDLYRFGIQSTAEELGIVAERVDEQHFSETILERVYRQIENCDFIIAEMTGQNPNVFYEVGYAHAKGKLCALITQDASDIPFDLKHHTHIIYDGSATDLAEKLRPKLEWLKEETNKAAEKRITIESKESLAFLDKTDNRHTGNFDLEVTLRNESDQKSPEIEGYYFTTKRDWKAKVGDKDCPYDDFEDDSGRKLRKHSVGANIRRLAPSAFDKIKLTLAREFWNRWSGLEKKKEYEVKGAIYFEIVTSEGTLRYDISLQVEFDEFPF